MKMNHIYSKYVMEPINPIGTLRYSTPRISVGPQSRVRDSLLRKGRNFQIRVAHNDTFLDKLQDKEITN